MPKLEGDAKAVYELVHDSDSLQKYEDPEGLGHGGKIIDWEAFDEIESATGANSLKGRFFHQPMHDAESAFWVIVAFLLQACPVDITEDAVVDDEKQGKNKEEGSPNKAIGDGDGDQDDGDSGDKTGDEEGKDATDGKLDDVWRLLAEHSIKNNGVDGRDTMFQFNVVCWRDALHPKLSFLAPMLRLLCAQVQPEYSLVTPAPHELHLHEAIQRILLTYIWNMKDSDHILLGQKLRAVTMQRYDIRVLTVELLSFGSKRPRNDEELPTEHRKSEFLSLMKSPFSHMCHLFREEQALE